MIRGLLERLKRKYGPLPLPLWAWAAIAGGALALWFRMRRPAPDATGAAIAEPAYAFGAEPDYGDTGGAPVDAGTGAPLVAEETPVDFYPDNKLRGAAMELIDQIRGYTDEIESARGGDVAGSEQVVEPDVPSDVGERAPAQPEQGVRWGGRVFKTKAALGSWLASRYAGRGQSRRAYDAWAKNHPAAAAKLSGPKPRPPKQDKPKAPKQPSSRTNREPAKGGRGAAGARARQPQKPKAKPARPRAPVARRQSPKPPPPKRRKAGRRR